MQSVSLRPATSDDAAFALHVTEAAGESMRNRLGEVGMAVLISISLSTRSSSLQGATSVRPGSIAVRLLVP
jgi:hypothetical protein